MAFRFATAFGMSPSMRIDLLVNGFVYSAKRRGYLVLYDKNARRTFIHVRDMARAFLFALDHCAAMGGQVYNAGSEALNHTKDEIARLILARHRYFLTYGAGRRGRGPARLRRVLPKARGVGFHDGDFPGGGH